MSRPEIIKELKIRHPNLTRSQIEIVIDAFFESIIESLISFKRSGASAIVTYFALDIAKKI